MVFVVGMRVHRENGAAWCPGPEAVSTQGLGKGASWLQAGHLAHVLKERSLLLVGQGAAQLERLLAGWEVQTKPGRPGGPQREPPACCLPASAPLRG